MFARALCAAKSVLVLDEPVKGFDSSATKKMYEISEDLHKQGITIITISHDLKAAQKYATKTLVLQKKQM